MKNSGRRTLIIRIILALTILLAACVTCAGAAAESGTWGSLNWTLQDGRLTVSGSGDMGSFSSGSSDAWLPYVSDIQRIEIKEGVTGIGNYAFSGCRNLWDVMIPSGLTSFGDHAFENCSYLSAVQIPEGVTGIGESAFAGCSSLLHAVIPSTVTSIGDSAFSGCAIRDVTIPEGVTSIGGAAFSDCVSVESVTIPEGVTAIGARAFRNCPSLTRVTIPSSVTSIGEGAFGSCSGLKKVVFRRDAGSTSPFACGTDPFADTDPGIRMYCYKNSAPHSWASANGYTTVCYEDLHGTWGSLSWTLEEGALTISGSGNMDDFAYDSEDAWRDCSMLIRSAVIQDGVTSIGRFAFYNCEYLASVTIPESMKSVADYAFVDTCHVDEVHIPSIGAWLSISFGNGDSIPGTLGLDYEKSFVTCLYVGGTEVTSAVIPEGVTAIRDYAFASCGHFTEITIPEGVTSIGDAAFADCWSLTELTLPQSVSSIGDYAFTGCWSLKSMEIPEGVTGIGEYVFGNCSYLESVSLPSSLTSIGKESFWDCESLTDITIPEGVTSIGDDAFNYCLSLTELTIPKNVVSIGNNAFDGCFSLKKIFFLHENAGTDYIRWGNNILQSINPLPTVYCHSGTAPWYWAESEGCPTVLFENIRTLRLPANLAEIKAETFAGTDCEEVIIPEGCQRIGSRAFAGCTKLVYVRIPKSVTSIAEDAFEGCEGVFLDRRK